MFSAVKNGHADGAQPLKIVAFGTSLTARGGWQPALETRLAACLQRPVKVESVAKSGETSLWALTQVDRVVAAQPDIILIELYANDATLHRFVSLAQSRKNIGDILDQLQQRLPQARIIVMAMNPFSGLRGLIRPFVNSYVSAHQAEAEKRGLEFVDHRPNWERLNRMTWPRQFPTACILSPTWPPKSSRLNSSNVSPATIAESEKISQIRHRFWRLPGQTAAI